MPRPTPQIIGQKFGHLIVIKKVSEKGHTKYLCQCDCGNSIEVFASNLISGHTKYTLVYARENLSPKLLKVTILRGI